MNFVEATRNSTLTHLDAFGCILTPSNQSDWPHSAPISKSRASYSVFLSPWGEGGGAKKRRVSSDVTAPPQSHYSHSFYLFYLIASITFICRRAQSNFYFIYSILFPFFLPFPLFFFCILYIYIYLFIYLSIYLSLSLFARWKPTI